MRRRPSGEARLRCRLPRRYPAAAAPSRGSRPPSPAAILRPWGAATEFGGHLRALELHFIGTECVRDAFRRRRARRGVSGTAGILPSRNFGEVGGRFRAPEPRFCGTQCVRDGFRRRSARRGVSGTAGILPSRNLGEVGGGYFLASEPCFCGTECVRGDSRRHRVHFGSRDPLGPFCGLLGVLRDPPGPPNAIRDPLSGEGNPDRPYPCSCPAFLVFSHMRFHPCLTFPVCPATPPSGCRVGASTLPPPPAIRAREGLCVIRDTCADSTFLAVRKRRKC